MTLSRPLADQVPNGTFVRRPRADDSLRYALQQSFATDQQLPSEWQALLGEIDRKSSARKPDER